MKDFLNELLPPVHRIKELAFKQSEQGEADNARKAVKRYFPLRVTSRREEIRIERTFYNNAFPEKR